MRTLCLCHPKDDSCNLEEIGQDNDIYGDLVHLVKWPEPPAHDVLFAGAVPDSINCGVLDENMAISCQSQQTCS